MKTVAERFLRYVGFDTQSDENSPSCPSSAKQKLLGAALVEEMKAMGISDAFMDEDGYVYGTVPGDPSLPTVGLIAHMDTSPDASGADIKTKTVEYTGADICLNEEKDIWLRASDYPGLKKHIGKHRKCSHPSASCQHFPDADFMMFPSRLSRFFIVLNFMTRKNNGPA